MPRPTAPPTPSSSTDLKSRDGSLFISSQMSFELPPPALTFDSRPSSTSAASSSSSYHPHSPMSGAQPAPAAKPRASTGRKRTSTAGSSAAKGAEPFDLPPPPTRTRKIIQMKPADAPASAPSADEQPAKTAAASKRKPPSATSAAGRKMARKTAHSLIERRRRSKMNEEFGVLKDMIPACKGEMHKLAILQASIEYVRYLEDCIAQLKSPFNTPTIAIRHESTSIAPHSYAASSSASEASHTDTEMTTAPPAFAQQSAQQHQQHQQQHHHHTQQPQQIPQQQHHHHTQQPQQIPQQQPSQSPPLRAAEDFQRTYSFSHSSSTSPAFGPQTYTGAPAWLGSAASSALTSPALGPMAEEETATVALMMLNGDWRMGEQRERERGGLWRGGRCRGRGG
ncbi:hypothetical protein VC83_02723 [Pseudogymnoascus destructans]|uniref:BHLH domain-containing protein n=1 Tax=Pseudogymnoascus destructans TaxID=655981 RepID=A0A177AG13_9PEZI|nr:uncharacterized protein VC83_02723 [Pseudogymnoascus destructans]OAF61048.1 hypothetical protein VC83_02723 [Pseudogymnoascus destructans]